MIGAIMCLSIEIKMKNKKKISSQPLVVGAGLKYKLFNASGAGLSFK
jgi:hypothetical protein